MTKLSYVIPAWNAEQTLDATVRSVLAQSEPAVEAVIVDDGSTDGTRHVAGALLGPRVRLVSQENRGLAWARNSGWRSAAGEWVCFLDADDAVAPAHAAALLGAIGTADAAACGYEFVGPGLEDLGWRSPVLASDTAHDRLIEVNRLAVGAVVLRRDCAERVLGGAMFDETLPVHEDWELFLRLAGAGAVWAAPVEETLFAYRLRPGSLSAGLERMTRVGLEVIGRHARSEAERAAATRGWRLRSLARAVAVGDQCQADEMVAELGPIGEADLPTLVGTLRWALARDAAAGPGEWDAWMPEWTERVRQVLESGDLAREVAQRLAFGPHRWRRAVERAREMLAPGETLVIYGYGRNGREAARAAAELGLPVAVVDDDPRVVGGAAAMRPEEVSAEHLVLVTPEARDGIVARLRERGVARIVLPDAA